MAARSLRECPPPSRHRKVPAANRKVSPALPLCATRRRKTAGASAGLHGPARGTLTRVGEALRHGDRFAAGTPGDESVLSYNRHEPTPFVVVLAMDVDRILKTFNAHQVQYLLIGGLNFLPRHQPVLTYDVDLWIEDSPANRRSTEAALVERQAEWGPSEADWRPVSAWGEGWSDRQAVFCLSAPAGAIVIFRTVRGLAVWSEWRQRAFSSVTAAGTPYWGLSDSDMLLCQTSLPEAAQKLDRIRVLRQAIQQVSGND